MKLTETSDNDLGEKAAGSCAPAHGEARQEGLEPSTCGLEIRCSIPLSYWREEGLTAPRSSRTPPSRFERETPAPEASGLSN